MAEMRGFVFCLSFILIFTGLITSMPIDFEGEEAEVELVTPIDISLITDFSETENFTSSDWVDYGYYWDYGYYGLGGRDWYISMEPSYVIALGAKIYYVGVWFATTDSVEFVINGTNRGYELSFAEINSDAVNGTVRYTCFYYGSGGSAGGFIIHWNSTEYTDFTDAWDNDDVYFLHGFGIQDRATSDAGSLLLSLLFFQLPNVPPLVNLLLATFPWACIIYLLWYIIKETMPFV